MHVVKANKEGILMGVLVTGAATLFYLLRMKKLKAKARNKPIEKSSYFLPSSEEGARDFGSIPHFNSTDDLKNCDKGTSKRLPHQDREREWTQQHIGRDDRDRERTTSTSSAQLGRRDSFSNWRHPEGKNIGPTSNSTWLRGTDMDLAVKTDLLHTGHSKGGKLVLCMVGLPGRGKSYIARKVARYLRWINYRTRVFSIARFRLETVGKKPAEFFDPSNQDSNKQRGEIRMATVETVLTYLNKGGEVAILDGSNLSIARRNEIRDRVGQEDGFEVMWIEIIATETKVMDSLIEESPDYNSRDDFFKRVELYQKTYETLQESEGAWVKIFDGGKRLEINRFNGFLPTKITSYIMNLQMETRPVFLSRHGESEFNEKGFVGGDSNLSPLGEKYAHKLADWVSECSDLPSDKLVVWTSTMRRTRQTARLIKCARSVQWRNLREIEVGICDGLTYQQIKELFPEEYRAREEDKLRYRYPRGESYLDIINRLEPILFEIERSSEPLLIVGHQAVHRCIYAYFLDLPPEEIPYLSIPLHTVIKLIPKAFGCAEKRFKLLEKEKGSKH